MGKSKKMLNGEEKRPPGWRVSDAVKEDFTTFCDSVNNGYEDACAAALTIWKYLPSQIREWATLEAKGTPAVDKKFWEIFSQGLEAGIQVLQQKKSRK